MSTSYLQPLCPEPPYHDPLASPEHAEVPVWNILPSYQLYQSTFSKNLALLNDDLALEPPQYADQHHIENNQVDYFAAAQLPLASTSSTEALTSPLYPARREHSTGLSAFELPTRWENSIQGNTHKLKRLVDPKLTMPPALKITISLTKGLHRVGTPPQHLDPSGIEFCRGDTINGYVTIKNESVVPVPFSMVYVVFEGRVSVRKPGGGDINDPRHSLIFYKFLNMFDYNALWTPANIELPSNDDAMVDPWDNSQLRFPNTRVFAPGITYKKLFSFLVPHKLLDCACENNNLPLHCEIIPTMGLARDQFLQEVRRLRKGKLGHSQSEGVDEVMKHKVKDFLFPDTAVSYSVEVRVVGKASDHPLVFKDKSSNDEFIIVNEESCFVRLIPYERLRLALDRKQVLRESKLVYDDLTKRIKDVLSAGADLSAGFDFDTSELLRRHHHKKRPQLYKAKLDCHQAGLSQYPSSSEHYEVAVSCYKKSLTVAPKFLGELSVRTPKTEYIGRYVMPKRFVRKNPAFPASPYSTAQRTITVPIEFIYKGANPPTEFKPPSVELVVFTYRTKKYPIALEFYHDHLFQNKRLRGDQSGDNFDFHVVQPFQLYMEQISRLIKVWGPENLNISNDLIKDIKSIANLQPKYDTIKIEHAKLSPSNWTNEASTVPSGRLSRIYVSHNTLSLDLDNLKMKKGEEYTLIPSFQSCVIGRLYYLKVTIAVPNGDPLVVKLPLSIEKSA